MWTFAENGVKFRVDLWQGQKTGFFLDQRDKREALRKYARQQTCLKLLLLYWWFFRLCGSDRSTRRV